MAVWQKDNSVILNANSPFSYREAYNALRTNVSYIMQKSGKKVLLVTSALPSEGKSTTSINLAIALAQTGARVVLIECDLRKKEGSLSLQMNKNEPGLTDMLMGKSKSGYCVKSISNLGIDVMPTGSLAANPTELLGSHAMGKILSVLRDHYDYVICDAPPVLTVTDATILSQFCDGVLLVVRQDFSVSKEVRLAKSKLEQVGADIIGAVMNCRTFSRKGEKRFYGYYN